MPSDVTQSDKSVLVTIDKLVHGGKGLAHDGAMAVFVEGVLPGESVRIQTERVKKGYAEGRLLEVVTPSPDRTRSEEHTSELQSHSDLVCRLLLEKKKKQQRGRRIALDERDHANDNAINEPAKT